MQVFGCVWKINFPEIIFSWLCVLKALTRKWFEVKIFTSNHFQTHAQREREREREREPSPQTELQFDDHSSTPIAALCRSQHCLALRQSQHCTLYRADCSKDRIAASHRRALLSSFFSQFDRIWWIFFFWVLFLLCFCIEEWYYIFVWQLRKCDQQVENVFSMVFSRTQPNTRKYFSKHFLKCN